ncbi:hypothetical protein ASD65_01665 [Microbacterium sp. Root61]|uniref:DUF1989 domain-containing protein n=1 Tax=Microbacterium sp. Root61 TaxID=1736570 RepID=UPI0006F5601B|nr:urea carboxylase-associated family protein [Microbacterium sp. Root61]KRA23266.1 hypothetical protein ASD65_01665 [Microbacterium sp. Root61]
MKQDLKTYWATGEHVEWDRQLREFGSADVPGTIVHDVVVPARGFLRARVVEAGDVIRIVNVAGQQVMDVMLYDADNIKNVASMSNTILAGGTNKLTTGVTVYAKNGQKLATVGLDTAGVAAADGGYCSDAVNELRYGIEGSPNCKQNLVASMAEYGMTPDDLEEGCFTAFLKLEHDHDGTTRLYPSPSKPGDVFELIAERRIIVSASACPSERAVTNNHNPTPMKVIIYTPATS